MADCYYNGGFARHTLFTAEETDILVRAVKDRELIVYGRRNTPKLASVKQAWEEIATIVTNQVHIHRDFSERKSLTLKKCNTTIQ